MCSGCQYAVLCCRRKLQIIGRSQDQVANGLCDPAIASLERVQADETHVAKPGLEHSPNGMW